VYPAPSDVIERYVTVATFVTQYAIPVAITSAAYGRIAIRLCGRTDGDGPDSEGSGRLVAGLLPTRRQRLCHDRVRRRSIALLAAVVVAFTVSWLPLNLYHIITDFHPDHSRFRYNRCTSAANWQSKDESVRAVKQVAIGIKATVYSDQQKLE
jgi:G protein-coupled receptor 83